MLITNKFQQYYLYMDFFGLWFYKNFKGSREKTPRNSNLTSLFSITRCIKKFGVNIS